MLWYRKDNYHPYIGKRAKRGLGCGEGIDYKPWFKVRDIPSGLGSAPQPLGILVPRTYQLLSHWEYAYFMYLERDPTIVDIREQFPILDIDATLNICAELGHAHKYRGGRPDAYTFDFVVTRQIEPGVLTYEAKSVKAPGALNVKTHREQCVEHIWADEHCLPWTLVDTTIFSKVVQDALRFMRSWPHNDFQPVPDQAQRFSDHFLCCHSHSQLLGDLIREVAKKMHLTEDVGMSIFKFAAWSKTINVDTKFGLSKNAPVALL